MGSVEDFESAEEDGAKTPLQQAPFTYGTESRRLFRDPDDHLVAGVCSGIANYFDFNPVWVRLLFAMALLLQVGLYIICHTMDCCTKGCYPCRPYGHERPEAGPTGFQKQL
jgi:phage shock protein PspC (stress-responsive transcriptional regulator)